MNTRTQLVNQEVEEQQKLNRIVKGQEIYNNGQISVLENDMFLIKDKYVVEDISTDISPIYTCTCPDYEFRPEYLCKHIFATILFQLESNKKVNGA